MDLESDLPFLTAMMDDHLRATELEEEAAIDGYLAEASEDERLRVVTEVDSLLRADEGGGLDPLELRMYLMIHCQTMIPDDGAATWFRRLRARLDGTWFG